MDLGPMIAKIASLKGKEEKSESPKEKKAEKKNPKLEKNEKFPFKKGKKS